ncbi:MAG TPA: hypothetical protein G4O09_09270 [Dehalococcoidia bacterium]|nr:hypothetical protein [Dehalococcoidia bacterium]
MTVLSPSWWRDRFSLLLKPARKCWPVALLALLMILLSSCISEVTTPPAPVTGPSSTPAQSPSTKPTFLPPEPASRPTSEKPLNVTLQYLGVEYDGTDSGPDNIYLLLVITDGYQQAVSRFLPEGGTFSMNNYQAVKLDQEVFSTDSVGDSFKVCILTYKRHDPKWQTDILIPSLAEIERGLAWGDYRSAQEILSTVDKHMAKSSTEFIGGGDQLIGYFEDVWGLNESLGIGKYIAVGTEDLRLWLSIWSEEEPPLPPPPVLLPDVSIDHVNMISTATIGQTRTDIICIRNQEPHPVTVQLKGTSLVTGEFSNDTVEVPADSCAWLEKDFICEGSGIVTINYHIYFRDTELDSWSGKLKVISSEPHVSMVEWRNSDASSPLERTLGGTDVTLYVEAPGYAGETFAAAIRKVEPDGSYSYQETVAVTIINGLGIGRWKAKWQPVDEGYLTYVFGVKDLCSGELTVVKKYEPPPDVAIDSVVVSPYVVAGEPRTDTVTIRNDEEELIFVRLKGHSSVDGEFYNLAVSVPAEESVSVDVTALCESPGVRTLTYKLYYQGAEFTAWAGLLEVF